MLLAKTKLDTIEVLISKALIDSYINHDEFVLVNNVLRKYNEMKKKCWKCCQIYYIITIETSCVSCKKNTVNKNSNVRRTKQNILI